MRQTRFGSITALRTPAPSRRLGRVAGLALVLLSVPAMASATEVVATASNAADTPRCIQQTGTHLAPSRTTRRAVPQAKPQADKPAASTACNGLSGTRYTREDIERTGATSVAEALRLLDPAVH